MTCKLKLKTKNFYLKLLPASSSSVRGVLMFSKWLHNKATTALLCRRYGWTMYFILNLLLWTLSTYDSVVAVVLVVVPVAVAVVMLTLLIYLHSSDRE